MELTDKQWEVIEPILPSSKSKPGKRGRPPVNKRAVFKGACNKDCVTAYS